MSPPPTTYTVFPIEPPASPSRLAAYKAIRLTSLQTDPHAFGSTYAREVAFSDDVWHQRLGSPFKRTLVAVPSVRSASSCEPGDDEAEAAEGEWVGTATVVGPSDIPPSVFAPIREAGIGANWAMYGVYAMWVHPAHRGRGVGAQLIKACLEWARTNVDSKFTSEHEGEFEKVVILPVYDDNVAGRALYSSNGFIELEGVSSEEGGKWMVAKV